MNGFFRFPLRGLHFILRHIAALDGKIERKLNASSLSEASADELLPPGAPDPFFENIRLITHAGGGLCGLAYLNCREAFEYYHGKGNRVFEYDVRRGEDGAFLLSHEGNGGVIDERFHPLSLDECIGNIETNSDIVTIFDCKFSDLEPFVYLLHGKMSEESVRRTVIQVFNEENIRQVRRCGPFQMLYVCMMNTDYVKAANLCLENGIGAVSVSIKAITERTGWQLFPERNIRVYAYTSNTLSEYRLLKERGVCGIFSDYLTEEELPEMGG